MVRVASKSSSRRKVLLGGLLGALSVASANNCAPLPVGGATGQFTWTGGDVSSECYTISGPVDECYSVKFEDPEFRFAVEQLDPLNNNQMMSSQGGSGGELRMRIRLDPGDNTILQFGCGLRDWYGTCTENGRTAPTPGGFSVSKCEYPAYPELAPGMIRTLQFPDEASCRQCMPAMLNDPVAAFADRQNCPMESLQDQGLSSKWWNGIAAFQNCRITDEFIEDNGTRYLKVTDYTTRTQTGRQNRVTGCDFDQQIGQQLVANGGCVRKRGYNTEWDEDRWLGVMFSETAPPAQSFYAHWWSDDQCTIRPMNGQTVFRVADGICHNNVRGLENVEWASSRGQMYTLTQGALHIDSYQNSGCTGQMMRQQVTIPQSGCADADVDMKDSGMWVTFENGDGPRPTLPVDVCDVWTLVEAQCYSSGDPHIYTIDTPNQDWPYQQVGDFVFYQSSHITIHTRMEALFNNMATSGNTAVAFQGPMTCGKRIEIYGEYQTGVSTYREKKFYVDGMLVNDIAQLQDMFTQGCDSACQLLFEHGELKFMFKGGSQLHLGALTRPYWGMNVYWQVEEAKRDGRNDIGLCRKQETEVKCSDNLMSVTPNYGANWCDDTRRRMIARRLLPFPDRDTNPDIVAICETNTPQLHADAEIFCECNGEISQGCMYDVCAAGDLEAGRDVKETCVKAVEQKTAPPTKMPTTAPTTLATEGDSCSDREDKQSCVERDQNGKRVCRWKKDKCSERKSKKTPETNGDCRKLKSEEKCTRKGRGACEWNFIDSLCNLVGFDGESGCTDLKRSQCKSNESCTWSKDNGCISAEDNN